MKNYTVRQIPKEKTHDWILNKHYAHRIPPIMFSFGLYDENLFLQGVCTYAMPCVQMNFGKCIFNDYVVNTYELNRLVINEGLEKNVLSFFVSETFKFFERPTCLVSFADPTNGHNGYIYQATNWIYTGRGELGGKSVNWIKDGRDFHGKTITVEWLKSTGFNYDDNKTLKENWVDYGGEIKDQERKHRYLYFIADKKQKKEMLKKLVYEILPYPKGDNRRYDSSYKPTTNAVLF